MRRAAAAVLVLALGAVGVLAGSARDPGAAGTLSCWPAGERAAYAAYEAALLGSPTRDKLLEWHQLLGAEPHIAGTPGDLRTIERIEKAFKDMGLEVERHTFWALLARPVGASLEILGPEPLRLDIREQALPQDPFASHPDQTAGWNAYSGSGEITAEIVYANYGAKADFEKLRELGVEVRGRIVLCRYGGNFRGYKVKFAQEAGAAGVVIFTDPSDSGYMKGITYPEGGYSNSTCIERGSINTLPYPGDPLTPGREATENAERLDAKEIALPRIPVQPVGWAAANEILQRMSGPGVPEKWQGGLPLAYRLTGGEGLRLRLRVEQERAIIPTSNVIGMLRGASEPGKMMVIGCHHDAWGCGASDPLAGTIALMEAARAFTDRARAGKRPARTVVFAAWGAEEFGIIGSTEWVERERRRLVKDAVAYINLDMASMGPDFNASTSPSLRRVVEEAAAGVPTARAKDGMTVFQAWSRRSEDPMLAGRPRFGELGGGSDHIGFVCHAGIASTSLGGGGSKGNSYHSTYDTLPWYWKVVGEDYEPALMVSRMTLAVSGRMASAPLLPLDPARYGLETRRQLIDITKRAAEAGVIAAPAMGREVAPELARLEGAALQFEAMARDVDRRLLAAVEAGAISGERLARVNALLIEADRAWLSEEGLPGRPWFKNLYAASDEDSGYAPWTLPLFRRAIEHKDRAALDAAEETYLGVFERLREIVTKIGAEVG
ncbi:MAG: M20/M25/M40 family metallo-hydrolase [Phycisphaerales bacterium]